MKIAHIASHQGNVGDILNHVGFYKHIIPKICADDIDKIELRDFYYKTKKRKYFDVEFAKFLNHYDLVIFGGGGFFDVQWLQSNTGTTLDFSADFVDALSTKVLVNAMGYHEYPGKTVNIMNSKYLSFINMINKKSNWLLTFRNDGSYSRMKRRYGDSLPTDLKVTPDNAFYCGLNAKKHAWGGKIIGMCITNDLFSKGFNDGVTPENFNIYMGNIINALCKKGFRVILIPHIPADIEIISKLFNYIENDFKRKMISVGMLDCNSKNAVENLFFTYSNCDCIVGMRFHSCIMSLNSRIPVLALAGHEQIQGLFMELDLQDYLMKIDNLEFKDRLIELVDMCLADREKTHDCYEAIYEDIEIKKEKYKMLIHSFIGT